MTQPRDLEEARKILQEFSDFKDDGNVEPWLWKRQVIAQALSTRTRETLERAAGVAKAHECGGEDDIICQHQNCAMLIEGGIRALIQEEARK